MKEIKYDDDDEETKDNMRDKEKIQKEKADNLIVKDMKVEMKGIEYISEENKDMKDVSKHDDYNSADKRDIQHSEYKRCKKMLD
jgi:hypothetical protein